MGDLEESERALRQAFELRERLLGADHPDTRASQIALGTVISARGDATRGERLLSAGLDNARRILPEDHPLIARASFDLAKSAQSLCGAAESMQLIEAVLPSYRRRYGDAHWHDRGRDDGSVMVVYVDVYAL